MKNLIYTMSKYPGRFDRFHQVKCHPKTFTYLLSIGVDQITITKDEPKKVYLGKVEVIVDREVPEDYMDFHLRQFVWIPQVNKSGRKGMTKKSV